MFYVSPGSALALDSCCLTATSWFLSFYLVLLNGERIMVRAVNKQMLVQPSTHETRSGFEEIKQTSNSPLGSWSNPQPCAIISNYY